MAKAELINEARELWRFLKDNGWCKQKKITKYTGISGVTTRKICNEFAGHFVSNTTDGYNVTTAVSSGEIEHSINDLRSRCEKMLRRADALERALQNRYQKCFEEDQ